MKKLLFTLVLAGATVCSSFAQTTATVSSNGKTKFSIGIDGGPTIGEISSVFDLAIGGSVKCEIPVEKNLYFTLSGGYEALLIKGSVKKELEDAGFTVKSLTGFIPEKGGIKYYISEGFYGEAQAGITFSTENGGGNSFVYSPGIGYTFKNFEAGARYEHWEDIGQIALRLAIRF